MIAPIRFPRPREGRPHHPLLLRARSSHIGLGAGWRWTCSCLSWHSGIPYPSPQRAYGAWNTHLIGRTRP